MLKSLFLAVVAAGSIVALSAVGASPASATGSKNCIDGKNRDNITHKWDGHDKITVATKNGKAICEDVKFYFSSFVMPATWDGNGFNDTAVPQTKHASVSATLKAKTDKPSATLKVDMPHECKNVQTDLYLAPEQLEVTKDNKIGNRLIAAKHKEAVGTCVVAQPPVVQQPQTPAETPQVLSTATPEALPATGIAPAGLITAAITAAGAYAAVYRARK